MGLGNVEEQNKQNVHKQNKQKLNNIISKLWQWPIEI